MEGGENTLDLKGQGRETRGHGADYGDVEEGSPSKTFFADPLVLVCGKEEKGILVRTVVTNRLRNFRHGEMSVLTYS